MLWLLLSVVIAYWILERTEFLETSYEEIGMFPRICLAVAWPLLLIKMVYNKFHNGTIAK